MLIRSRASEPIRVRALQVQINHAPRLGRLPNFHFNIAGLHTTAAVFAKFAGLLLRCGGMENLHQLVLYSD